MDVQRAQEIDFSPDMINITYNGENIYIEHVDSQIEQLQSISLKNQMRNKVFLQQA